MIRKESIFSAAIIQNASKKKNSNKSSDETQPRPDFSYSKSKTQYKSKWDTTPRGNIPSSESPENVSASCVWRKNGTKSEKDFKAIKEVAVNIQNQKSQSVSFDNMPCHSRTVKDNIADQLKKRTEKEVLELKLKETEENIKKLKMCIARRKEIQKFKDHLTYADSPSSSENTSDTKLIQRRTSPKSNGQAKSKFKSVTPISDLISSNIQRQEDSTDLSGQHKERNYNTVHFKTSHSSWWQNSKFQRHQQISHWQKTRSQWHQPKPWWQSTTAAKDSAITPISDLITKNIQRQAVLELEQKHPFAEVQQGLKDNLNTNGKIVGSKSAVPTFRKSSTKSKILSVTPISDQISRNLAKMASQKYPKFPSEKKWTKQNHSVKGGEVKLSYQHSWHSKSKTNSQYSWQSKSQKVANVIKSKYRVSYIANRNNFRTPPSPGNAWKNNLRFCIAKPTHRNYLKWWINKGLILIWFIFRSFF